MKFTIKSVIFLITIIMGITVFQAANNLLECRSELGVAGTKISPYDMGTKDTIKEAYNSQACQKMTTFGRVVEKVFSK